MADDLFQDHKVLLKCPKCGNNLSSTVGRLEQNPEVVCSQCHSSVTIAADKLRRARKDLKTVLGKLRKTLPLDL